MDPGWLGSKLEGEYPLGFPTEQLTFNDESRRMIKHRARTAGPHVHNLIESCNDLQEKCQLHA